MSSRDTEEITAKWLQVCGACDVGMPEYGCTHPAEDYRPVLLKLLRERDEARDEMGRTRPVVEAARAWAHSSFGADLSPLDGDDYYYSAEELALLRAVHVLEGGADVQS